MTNPKRTIAAALLCLCILPLLAVSQTLKELKKTLQTEMASTKKAVERKSEFNIEWQMLRQAVKNFEDKRATADNADVLEGQAKDLIKRAEELRGKAELPEGSPLGGGGDDVMSSGEVERQKQELHGRVKAAVTEADAAGAAVAADNPSIADRVTQLNKRWGEFEADYNKVNKKQELLALEGRGNNLIRDAQALKTDAQRLSPELLDRIFSPDTLLLLGKILTGLAAIALLGYAGWFVFKLNRRVGELKRRHNDVVQRLGVFEKALGEQDVFAQSVNSGLVRMREDVSREMEELRRSYRDMRGGQRAPAAAAAVELFPQVEREPAPDPGPSFPALVSDYLSRVSDSKKVEVISDFRTHLFVPESGGPFVLVQDEDGTGSGIVLPKARLQRGQEFAHYRGTYYCDSPSAGDVFVVEPAVVERADGGWRLRRPGRLELK